MPSAESFTFQSPGHARAPAATARGCGWEGGLYVSAGGVSGGCGRPGDLCPTAENAPPHTTLGLGPVRVRPPAAFASSEASAAGASGDSVPSHLFLSVPHPKEGLCPTTPGLCHLPRPSCPHLATRCFCLLTFPNVFMCGHWFRGHKCFHGLQHVPFRGATSTWEFTS